MKHYDIKIDVDSDESMLELIVAAAKTLIKHLDDGLTDVQMTVTENDDVVAEWQCASRTAQWERTRQKAIALQDAGDLVSAVRLVLYPPGDPKRQWDIDTVEVIAELVDRYDSKLQRNVDTVEAIAKLIEP